ncbi:MAG: ATP-binding protein [Promethearchaeati archaeon SRVP18_Atabeyarchaeia-1]
MKFEIDNFGAKLLEAITEGLYSDNLNCLREYVQNSLDADPKKVKIYFETKSPESLDLVIHDDGSGMNKAKLKEALSVGLSYKPPENVGWRGIGIWSGVPVCEKIVITTKKKNEKKLRIEIDCKKLRQSYGTNRSAADVLSESTGEIEETNLDSGESVKDHFTVVRLCSILTTHKSMFQKEKIIKYLSRTVPAPFNKKFLLADKVNDYLKEHDVELPEVVIEFEGDPISRPPDDVDIFLVNDLVPKEFKVNGEIVAFGWFLTNKENKELGEPNKGIFFKKKGFTIGDEHFIENLSSGHSEWQYGEIHIVTPKIVENAARNNFVPSTELVAPFFQQVGSFVDEFQISNRYQSDKNQAKSIEKAKHHLAKGNTNSAKKCLEKAKKAMSSGRSFATDPALQPHKQVIDDKCKQAAKEVATLEAEIKKKLPEEDDLAKAKELQKSMLGLLPKPVRSDFDKLTPEGKLQPETSMLDKIVELLKKKTGLSTNEIFGLSKAAYGWEKVISHSTRKLTISGSSTDPQETRRNPELGVTIQALQDLFINAQKHDKGSDSFKWFEDLTKAERCNVMTMFSATVGLVYRMIELSQKCPP